MTRARCCIGMNCGASPRPPVRDASGPSRMPSAVDIRAPPPPRDDHAPAMAPMARRVQTSLMSASDQLTPKGVAAALAEAMNARDIEAFVALFAPDYDSRQPA